MTIYKFTGSGGIAGLPHSVTKKQAEQLGVIDVLEEAIKNGSYKADTKKAPKKAAEVKDG